MEQEEKNVKKVKATEEPKKTATTKKTTTTKKASTTKKSDSTKKTTTSRTKKVSEKTTTKKASTSKAENTKKGTTPKRKASIAKSDNSNENKIEEIAVKKETITAIDKDALKELTKGLLKPDEFENNIKKDNSQDKKELIKEVPNKKENKKTKKIKEKKDKKLKDKKENKEPKKDKIKESKESKKERLKQEKEAKKAQIKEEKEKRKQELEERKKQKRKNRREKRKEKTNKESNKAEKNEEKDKKPKIEKNKEIEKSEIKPIEKKEKKAKKEKKPKKEKKKEPFDENKKHVDVSFGKILGVILTISLIVLNIKLGKIVINIFDNNNSEEEVNTGVLFEEDKDVTERGIQIDLENDIVTKLIEKITFDPNATASLYAEGTFDMNTITNDLKLRLGWAKIKNESKLRSSNEDNETIIAVDETTMDESIKNIFGDKVKYQKQDFENTNVSIFSAYNKVLGTIEYTGGLYSGFEVQDEEQKMVPLIYQEIQKAEQYTDKVIVYVKTAFIDVENEKYSIYRNFDNNFYGELQKISEYDLFGENSFNKETGEGSIVNKNNINLDSIREQLNTYKYTFSLNQKTGEYFLSEFNKEIK